MSETIQISRQELPGRITILRVQGRLDAKATDRLEAQAKEVALQGRDLIINFKDVTFIGSSGVGLMLTLTDDFREQAGCVRFVELSPPVRSVVDLLQMMDLIAIDRDEAAGVAALKKAA